MTEPPIDLAARYAARHTAMENYVVAWFIAFRLIRSLGIDPHSTAGRVANFVWVGGLLVATPCAVAAISGELDLSELLRWSVVGLLFGAFAALSYGPLSRAIDGFACIHRAMSSAGDLTRMIEWDRRWFSMTRGVPFAAVFSTVSVALLVHAAARTPLSSGSITLSAMLLFEVGEVLYALIMLGFEARRLPIAPYRLYRLAPMDTVHVRRALAGSNRLAILAGIIATAIIFSFAIILGDRTEVAIPFAGALFFVTCIAVGSGALLPRLAVMGIVTDQKERDLAELQAKIGVLFERDALSQDERAELARLKAMHDEIRGSGDSTLPLRSLANLATSLLLPLITFLVTEGGRRMIANLLDR